MILVVLVVFVTVILNYGGINSIFFIFYELHYLFLVSFTLVGWIFLFFDLYDHNPLFFMLPNLSLWAIS